MGGIEQCRARLLGYLVRRAGAHEVYDNIWSWFPDKTGLALTWIIKSLLPALLGCMRYMFDTMNGENGRKARDPAGHVRWVKTTGSRPGL